MTRLRFVAETVRDIREPLDWPESEVAHYSIPNLDQHGGALLEVRESIGSSKLLVHSGDSLVSKLNPHKPRVHEVTHTAALASSEFIVLRQPTVDPRYLRYFLQSDTATQDLVSRTRSVTRSHQRATEDSVLNLEVPSVDRDRSRVVADFLDRETHLIDSLVEAKKKLIGLLAEKRAALITHAVTKGLDPTSPTTESGVPWAPQIPSHWDTALANKISRLGSGHTPSRSKPEWWVDCTIPWITTGEVAQLRDDRIEYLYETREKVSEVGMANSSAVLHPTGTVFLSRTASAGFSGIMGSDMATSQDFVTWTCGPKINPRFLLLCLRAMRLDLLKRLAQGSTHKTIYVPDIAAIKVPLPPLEEQEHIVSDVWRRVGPSYAATDALSRQLDLLAEYRQALVTAAVTGQLDETSLKGDKPLEEAMETEIPA